MKSSKTILEQLVMLIDRLIAVIAEPAWGQGYSIVLIKHQVIVAYPFPWNP